MSAMPRLLPMRLESYLEDHARGDDGRNTQFHKSSSVTRHHHSQPVQGIRGVCSSISHPLRLWSLLLYD